MIAYLDGTIKEKDINNIVIDVGGIGYFVFVTSEDIGSLTVDNAAKLYIYEHIREQSHDLFGFIKIETKKLFEKLVDVNGVGPRMALSMMSIGSADKLRKAISEGDVRFIQSANGVGKRVAERVVVDLKDKVGLLSADSATDFLHSQEGDEAHQALVSLGFASYEASKALSGIDNKLSVEEKVKLALKKGK